jgi:hypothetical protein
MNFGTQKIDYSNRVEKAAAYGSLIEKSITVTRTRRHKELTKETDKPDGKPVLCQRTFSSVFRAVF